MCHQVIQIFKCGHNSGSKVVICKKPTAECDAVFLREELEKFKGLCEACRRAAERNQAEKTRAAKAVDEGYWS